MDAAQDRGGQSCKCLKQPTRWIPSPRGRLVWIWDPGSNHLNQAGKAVRPAELRGLRSLERLARRPMRKLVVFQGAARQRLEGEIEAIPWLDFLLETIGELG